MTLIPQSAYTDKILDPVKHARLLVDIDKHAARAGIAPHWIWRKAGDYASEIEVMYCRKCLQLADGDPPKIGLVLYGAVDCTNRMAAMTGALIRTFTDARLVSALRVAELVEEEGQVDATVLFIPNLYSKAEVGKFDQKRAALLGEELARRAALALPTVVHVEDYDGAKHWLGHRTANLFDSNYLSTPVT